jgi:opacity protein-like surface antigen
MKKIFGLVTLLAISALPALAQGGFEGTTPKVEVEGGYSFLSWGLPASDGRLNMNGWQAEGNYNVNKFLGLALDTAGTKNYQGENGTEGIYTFMAGPRFYPLGHHKLTPFVHVMGGLSHYSLFLPADSESPAFSYSENHFAFGFGGGLDAAVTRTMSIRVAQVDYERTVFNVFEDLPSQNNIRFSAGVVFRLGSR